MSADSGRRPLAGAGRRFVLFCKSLPDLPALPAAALTWWLVAAGCAVPLLAAYPLGATGAPSAVAAAFIPQAGAAAVVLAAAAAVRRRRVLALLAGVLAVVHALVLAPLLVGADDRGGTPLRVMTANLLYTQADPQALVELVRRERVQVLAVQELTGDGVQVLAASGLQELLPYRLLDVGVGAEGTGLWSALPLTKVPGWHGLFLSTAATVDVAGQQVLIRSMHPMPPGLGSQDNWIGDFATIEDYARGDRRLDRTVLLGDFNATLDHAPLRALMTGRWRDAAESTGAGLHATWGPGANAPALFAIDHVLVPPAFGIAQVSVHDLPGSDHDAVVATVLVRRLHD